MFQPRIGHYQAHKNNKKTYIEEDGVQVVVSLHTVK